MLQFIEANFSNLLALFAVITSLLTVFYTRKNIKAQKFIETITKQRILWIDTLRNDFSKILAHTTMIGYCHEVEEYDWHVGYEGSREEKEEIDYNTFVKDMESKKKELELENYQVISLIELSILRLNDRDDSNLINELVVLKGIFKSRNYSDIKNDFIDNLRNLIKEILKNEWEKVKKETIKGGLINVKSRKNDEIFE